MKIHRMAQASPEWLAIRAGIPTASEFNRLLTPAKLEFAKWDSYLYTKLAERWLGRPLMEQASTFHMEQGNILEDHAIPWYELHYQCTIERVGFLTTDDGKYGCSPDGMIRLDEPRRGAEIKCPKANTHCEYLLAGVLPPEYRGQVQGCMLVTGAPSWVFMSYCRGFPQFVLEVQRDEPYLSKLAKALDLFTAELETLYNRLLEINGGPPDREPVAVETAPGVLTMEGVPSDALESFYESEAYKRIDA